MAVDATTQLQHYNLLIGGSNVSAATGETFDTVGPTTNEPVRAWERRVWKTSMTPTNCSRNSRNTNSRKSPEPSAAGSFEIARRTRCAILNDWRCSSSTSAMR